MQVALRMKKKGLSARTGDFIPYVICLTADGKELDKNISDRAFHPDEINESNLRIGKFIIFMLFVFVFVNLSDDINNFMIYYLLRL